MSTSKTQLSFSQIGKIHDIMVQAGVTRPVLQDLLESGIFSDLANAAVFGTIPDRKEFCRTLGLDSTFRFTVDYSLTLQQMIAAGNFELIGSDLSEIVGQIHLSGTGKQQQVGKTVDLFNDSSVPSQFSKEYLRNFLNKRGLRLGKIEELLALGAQCPLMAENDPDDPGHSKDTNVSAPGSLVDVRDEMCFFNLRVSDGTLSLVCCEGLIDKYETLFLGIVK